MIYVILLSIVVACIAVYFWKERRFWKRRANLYYNHYTEAKDEWASQSNAVREKGIECDQLIKKNKRLEKELDDANEQLGHRIQ